MIAYYQPVKFDPGTIALFSLFINYSSIKMTDLGLEKTYCGICNFEFADALLYYIHEQESHLETAKLSIPSETGTLYYYYLE
jgi:hypothetical protein